MTTAVRSGAETLAERIRDAVSSKEIEMPPLPELLVRLEAMLADVDGASTRDVADLIASDPAITAGLLRIANSAAYGGLSEISDVAQAVARVGLRQVRAFVSAIVHKANFEAADPSRVQLVRSLWQHAVSTAVAARRLAEETCGDADHAFLAGLLHDAGKLLVLRGVSHVEQAGDAVEMTETVLAELMDALHADLGEHVLRCWHLPEEICSVARSHEAASVDAADRLAHTVRLANAMSKRLGMHPRPQPELNVMDEDAVELLGLDEIRIASLMVDVEDELEQLRSLL